MSFIHRGMLDEVKASERSVTSSGVCKMDMVSIIAVPLSVPFLRRTENLRNRRCETLVSQCWTITRHPPVLLLFVQRVECMCVDIHVTGPFKGLFFLMQRTTAESQTCRFIAEWEIAHNIC